MKKQLFDKFPILDLSKYILRELDMDDYLDIYEIYSDNETLKYQTMGCFKGEQDAKDFIEEVLKAYQDKRFVRWAIEMKGDCKLIGLIALYDINVEDGTAKLGYILNRNYWHKSIMYENLKYLIDFLFEKVDLKLLEVQIHPENNDSINLASKLGFIQKEGNKEISSIRKSGILMKLLNN